MPWLWSVSSRMFSIAAGRKKLGQPVPDSNFVPDSNSGRLQHTHTYMPAFLLFNKPPQKARSVSFPRVMRNCSGVSRLRHSASESAIAGVSMASVSLPSGPMTRTRTNDMGVLPLGLAAIASDPAGPVQPPANNRNSNPKPACNRIGNP